MKPTRAFSPLARNLLNVSSILLMTAYPFKRESIHHRDTEGTEQSKIQQDKQRFQGLEVAISVNPVNPV
jgi:hypothetical protein